MKKKWSSLFYTLTIAGAAGAIYWIGKQGRLLQSPVLTAKEIQAEGKSAARSSFQEFAGSFSTHISEPIAVLLMQIIIIIFFARIFGYLFKKVGQPAVIGEIVAGIVLGPSILGSYFPEITQFLFPAASLGTLNFLSQIGLILFMFIIGMELDLKAIGKQAYDAVVISHARPRRRGHGGASPYARAGAPSTRQRGRSAPGLRRPG